jgi:hypothetical protein
MYELTFSISLGQSKSGLSLEAQIMDNAGNNVGSASSLGFVELGAGNYAFNSGNIPAGHRGIIKFYESGSASSPLAIAPINPETAEFMDTRLSLISGGAGSGSVRTTITVTDESATPLDGVAVWVSTDSTGNNIVAGTLFTNALGEVVFMLDAGNYYVWKQLSGFNFTNPTLITVVQS